MSIEIRIEGLITNSGFVVDYWSILSVEFLPLRLPHNFMKFSRERSTRIYNVTINYCLIPNMLIKILLHDIQNEVILTQRPETDA